MYRSLILLLLGSLVTSAMHQSAQASCVASLEGADLEINPEMREQLELARNWYFEVVSSKWQDRGRVPKKIRIGKSTYAVVRRLGSQTQGQVLQVQSPNGELRQAKKFDTKNDLVLGVKGLRDLSKDGLRTLEDLEVDESTKTAIFPYIHGLDLGMIFSKSQNFVTDENKQLIEDAYTKFIDRLGEDCIGVIPGPRNVLLNFMTGQFVVIDRY